MKDIWITDQDWSSKEFFDDQATSTYYVGQYNIWLDYYYFTVRHGTH